jgi:Uma2 family endonuclease
MNIDVSLLAPERVRPLKKNEYDRMVEMGCFEGEHVELLRGGLVEMSPQGPAHANLTEVLAGMLRDRLRDRARVRQHSPFALSDVSEPEPDVAVVPLGDYSRSHPQRAFLLVEVADSSLMKDRRIKADLYAEGGIPEYWIVDIQAQAIELYRSPASGRYGDMKTAGKAEKLALQAFPDVEVNLMELFAG